MKILLVSDTHGREDRLEEAVHTEWPFDYMIHCGDVHGSGQYISRMVPCACLIVAGNNDIFTELPREVVLPLAGHRLLVVHGHRQSVHGGFSGLLPRTGTGDSQRHHSKVRHRSKFIAFHCGLVKMYSEARLIFSENQRSSASSLQ